MTAGHSVTAGTRWSGLETAGMKEARCSLVIQENVSYSAKVKALPKQRVLVYQDKGFDPASNNLQQQSPEEEENNFYVDFKGATILQLEPGSIGGAAHQTMPVTMTVGGRCVFTPENFQDFRVMMRTKEQSQEMDIAPNGNFDWPDVSSLLLCPCCGKKGPIPREGDRQQHEYWMVFFPLLQITVMKGSQLTLGTRTVCRLTCLDCMEDLLEDLTITIQPGGAGASEGNSNTGSGSAAVDGGELQQSRKSICFTLPAADVLAEAGSASFLQDGPARPETHPHVDDILDAWTLYNLWEHSGAWEALQNDYRIILARSMRAEPSPGSSSGNPDNNSDKNSGGDNHSAASSSEPARKQRDREERREKKAKKVQCDTCQKKFPYTKMKKCSKCRNATYCSVDCQRVDWEQHRFVCQVAR